MENLKQKFNILVQKGMFHIFGTSLVNNIIQFITNIVVIKLVSKSDYGIYTYANNIVGFFLMARGLGLVSGMLQYASEKEKQIEQAEIFKYSLIRGNQYNTVLSVILLIWTLVGSLKIEGARSYLIAMFLFPVFQWMFDYVSTIFRVKRENIKYARITNINTVSYCLCTLLGAYLWGAWGLVWGRYLSFLISVIVAGVWLKSDIALLKSGKISKYNQAKALDKYSRVCCASNVISELLYLLDIFLIGVFIANPAVIASYKVATQIPTALAFIPTGIITFVYPYFASRNSDMKWVKVNYVRLIKVLALINGVICVGLFIFAPLVVNILWGASYSDAILPFRILAINYFFLGTFRIPCGNILAMLRKVKVNLVVSIISGISNIILDIALINMYGSVGAAIATVLVVIISSAIAFPYLVWYVNKRIAEEETRKLH